MRIPAVIFLLITFTATAQKQNNSYFLARTSARISMLAYSLGTEQLGGAKSGYLDTSVLLKITDSSQEMYKVQLSKAHTAYINKYDVVKDIFAAAPPVYLTGSFSVTGDELYDYVNISLDEKLPYKSRMDMDPARTARIYIELYGARSNTKWINQLQSVKEIKDVYLNQEEDDVVKVTIDLKHKQHWGYSIYYKDKTLCIRIRRQPRSLKVSKLLIAVDAGHGGSDSGAAGITGKGFEKTYTLRFANELEKYLKKKGSAVIMTRTADTNINNIDRLILLQNAMPDISVSLHFNSSANNDVKGVSTYYNHIGFRPLAAALLNRLLQLDLSEFGVVGNSDYTLNAPTNFPDALVEIAFLSNAEDEKKIIDPRFQKAAAKKIYKGIKDWLKMAKE